MLALLHGGTLIAEQARCETLLVPSDGADDRGTDLSLTDCRLADNNLNTISAASWRTLPVLRTSARVIVNDVGALAGLCTMRIATDS